MSDDVKRYVPRAGSKAEAALAALIGQPMTREQLAAEMDCDRNSVDGNLAVAIGHGAIVRVVDVLGRPFLARGDEPLPDGYRRKEDAEAQRVNELVSGFNRALAPTAAAADETAPVKKASKRSAAKAARKPARKAAKRRAAVATTEPTPAAAEAPAGPPAGPALATFGLFSDGTLCVARGDETVASLPPAETRALIEYLVVNQALVQCLFDGSTGKAVGRMK